MDTHRHPVATALALSLGAAVALGLTRFAYALLLPAMRQDLGWSYLLAGGMNTGNAVGYLLGALMSPALMRRVGPARMLVLGTVVAGLFMLASAAVTGASALVGLRVLAGVASAWVFIAGGLLAAQLGAQHTQRAGWLIGLYYGGTGIGILVSALLVPAVLSLAQARGAAHVWQWPWAALGLACLLAALLLRAPARAMGAPVAGPVAGQQQARLRGLGFGMASYFCFGAGYIGYMTFIVALLREQGLSGAQITGFYALLGIAVMASARIWARMLDRFKGGESMAILNAVLAVATVLPVLTTARPALFASGLVFGAVFLSVVASTTALVRHNLPQPAWPAGIGAFTTVFALGQIVGPSLIGLVADGAGGLQRGLLVSAACLMVAAALALVQRPLANQVV